MTIGKLIENATKAFLSQGLPTPRLDAEVLLASYLNEDRTWLYIHSGQDMNATDAAGFSRWVKRRQQGEPVAYIIGCKEFWSLDFAVDSRVLIPRPDTEVLVEEVLKALDINKTSGKTSGPEILDLGTGSGAIAVALAHECPEARITATDISREALAVAAGNAERNRVASRITFLDGNLFSPVKGCFDVIVSNPPYITGGDYSQLAVGVRNFEPLEALLAGKEGMDFYESQFFTPPYSRVVFTELSRIPTSQIPFFLRKLQQFEESVWIIAMDIPAFPFRLLRPSAIRVNIESIKAYILTGSALTHICLARSRQNPGFNSKPRVQMSQLRSHFIDA